MNSKSSILFLFLLCGFTVQAQTGSKNLTAGEKAFVLSKFCTEVKYNFVFYNDLPFNWDSLCVSALPALLETKSYDAYVNGLKHLCAKLNDGHTSIHTGNSGNSADWTRPLPMKTKRVGDRVFVTEVLNSGFREKGIGFGSEVIQIDGLNVIDYVNKHKRAYVSSSTPQWLEYSPYAGFELTKEKGTKVSKILFRNQDGKEIMIESNRNIHWDIESNSIFDFKVLKNNTGLLKINTFTGNDFIQRFDKLYQDIEKTDALIIDLRDNFGGNSYYADYIIRHLSASPAKLGSWSSRMYIAAHGSWGYPQEWYMSTPHDLQPVEGKTIYSKPVVVLVNATTFSSAENFCVAFRGLKKGKIIGTPTGGSTGNPINIDLGFNIFAQICTKNEWDVDGNKFIGIGIKPDVEIEETADVFLNGKDVVIEKALKINEEE